MFCPKCGHKNPDDAQFCMKCGATIQAAADAPAPPAPAGPATPAWQAPINPAAGWAAPSYGPPAPPPSVHPPAAPLVGHAETTAHGHPAATPLAAEQQVWTGAMSWKGMLTLGWLFLFIVPLPLIIGAFSMRAHLGGGYWWALSLLSLIPIVVFLVRLWMVRTTTYRITTERISVLKGILSRESDDLQLIRVADVQFYQSLLARLLGVGDIRVLSTDKTVPDLVIPGVESPAEFKEMLWNLVRERRRNLVAMEQLNQGLGTPPAF